MKQPENIDRIISNNLKKARLKSTLTQYQVAIEIGITYQQLQKYESGANRITAGRLWNLSQLYKIPIDSFFEH